jgi:CBS domain-containing protein
MEDPEMIKEYAALSHIRLHAGTPCHTPAGWAPLAHLDDPAMNVMTDFKKISPVTIEPYSSIQTALRKMKVAGVRLLLVPDEADHIAGIITAGDIQGERPIKVIQETRAAFRDIRVDRIMTPLDRVEGMDMVTVRDARVGHIIVTMRKLEQHHLLVVEVDRENRQHRLRGLFSTSEISRLTGYDITEPEYAAHSLAEVRHELGG